MARRNRKVRDIKYDLDKCIEKFKINRAFILLSIFTFSGLSFLYYQFVQGKGNMFDYIVSGIVLLFFAFQIFRQYSLANKRYKERKILQREYDIATETPEQKLKRERTEKFSRILKVEEELV